MSKPVTGPVESTSFDISVTLATGESVVITVAYPVNQGILAIQALSQVAEAKYLQGLLSALRADPSVKAKLEELHLGFEDEADEGSF